MSKVRVPSGNLKTRNRRTDILLLVAFATMLGIAAYATLSGTPRGERVVPGQGTAARVPSRLEVAATMLADPRIGEVAGEFHCPCGGCGVMELKECECDMPRGALEAKGEIAELLLQGVAPAEVVERIASQYGSRKAPQQEAADPRALLEDGPGAR